MEMVPVSDFYPVLRHMTDVPLNADMDVALIRSASEFCRDSQVIVHTRGLDWVRAGTTLNLIESSGLNHRTLGDIKSAGLISVSADGQPLMAERDYEVLSLDQIYALQPWKRVHLVIAVEPALTTHFFPAALWEDWQEAICHGAASRLYAVPGALHLERVRFHEQAFTEGKRRARRWRLENHPSLSLPPVRHQREFY
ncbi:hypothetical protein [Vibrio penaeicida]|uniref:AraC family transcriptional regulator n=2 Tax=Vibrio penaeicida TaxID=104609 RepID=A0AAV5NQG1_9VIBR|nr:hypothetical protein [Vibrio penaeicida]GLQ72911.1 hypothetical protein GCM10007932_22710 [Vibrio penaeicida]